MDLSVSCRVTSNSVLWLLGLNTYADTTFLFLILVTSMFGLNQDTLQFHC